MKYLVGRAWRGWDFGLGIPDSKCLYAMVEPGLALRPSSMLLRQKRE